MMRRQCAKTIGILFALLVFALPVSAAVNNLDYKKVTAISMAIESIELEGRKDFFLPPGTDGQLVAKTHPANLNIKVRWEIASRSKNLKLELNPDTGRLVVEPNSALGWITVRASAEGCLPLDRRIDIDCECREEYGPCESTVVGGGEVNIGSVDVRLSLGKVAGGRSAGDLFLFAEEPLGDSLHPGSHGHQQQQRPGDPHLSRRSPGADHYAPGHRELHPLLSPLSMKCIFTISVFAGKSWKTGPTASTPRRCPWSSGASKIRTRPGKP